MTRPNIQIPKEFAINGEKADFTQEKIQTGFDKLNPDIFAGDNLNKFVDDTYKGLNGVLDLYNGVVLHEMTTTYDDKAVVGKFIENNFKLYRSLVNDNTGHEVIETEYWEEVALGGGGSSLPIGSTVVLDKVLSFEESQGLALQGTYVYKTAVAGERYGYPDFYNTYVNYKNNATATQTTLGSSTITIYNNANGLKFYNIADKGVIDTWFNSTGVADFYGVDETNERIFLPRNNKYWQFTTNTGEVNNYVEAGLPNITGSIGVRAGVDTHNDGAFSYSRGTSTAQISTSGSGEDVRWNFNASLSNPIYGNSTTVQPPSSKKLLYYVVGNTVSDTSWVDVVTQVEGGVKDLEDKTQEGIARLKASSNALTTTQITNCITEIPQDIKLELNDGVLTLKAGSKIYMPNGFEADGTTPKFDEVVIEQDKVLSLTSATKNYNYMMTYRKDDVFRYFNVIQISSGTVATTGQKYLLWYDTTNNLIKESTDNGSTWLTDVCSLPLCLVSGNTTSFTSIDQTFNGFGYIGSTFFVTKGVKGLIPNGRNADGSLKNIEVTTNSVSTIQVGEKSREVTAFLFNTGEITKWGSDNGNIRQYKSRPATPEKTYVKAYIEDENVWWYGNATTTWVEKQYLVPLFKVYTNANAQILSADLKLPFRAVDYSDSSTVSSWGMPSDKYINLTLGASGTKYTAPANGWIAIKKVSGGADKYLNIYVHNSDDTEDMYALVAWGLSSGSTILAYVPIQKGRKFVVNYNATGETTFFKFIYAEGEV